MAVRRTAKRFAILCSPKYGLSTQQKVKREM